MIKKIMEHIQTYLEYNEGIKSGLKKLGLATAMGAAVIGTTLPMTSCKKDLMEIGVGKPKFEFNITETDTVHEWQIGPAGDSLGKVPYDVFTIEGKLITNVSCDGWGVDVNNGYYDNGFVIPNSSQWPIFQVIGNDSWLNGWGNPVKITQITIKPYIYTGYDGTTPINKIYGKTVILYP